MLLLWELSQMRRSTISASKNLPRVTMMVTLGFF
nr:MAG TPA: hypothetical protein [Caudoviricetes sp.]